MNTSPVSVLTDAHGALFLSVEVDRVQINKAGGDAQSLSPVRNDSVPQPQPDGISTRICGH